MFDRWRLDPRIRSANPRVKGIFLTALRICVGHRIPEIRNPGNTSQARERQTDQMGCRDRIGRPDHVRAVLAYQVATESHRAWPPRDPLVGKRERLEILAAQR